ncbi:ABC transporter permease [Streptomyces sp. NPDC046909]|uniref:ABC transporter permease n=1 Tax=Streptomyces sp. NPDC046909 TaxID=3155617 RepID=UPI0033FDD4F4
MLTHVLLVAGREISHRLRYPSWALMEIAQPVLFLFFFGPLLTQFVRHTPGFPPGDSWTIFAPALMIQMVLVGASTVGIGLLTEQRGGVLERFLVTPMHPVSLLLGKVLTVTMTTLIQSCLIVLICVAAFDLRVPPTGLAASLLLVALLAVALASTSYAVALRVPDENTLPTVINALLMPLLLLSGSFLPITVGLAPRWLYEASRLNPVAYVMDATRAYFRGDFSAASSWAGAVCAVGLAVGAMAWAVASFRKLSWGAQRHM